MDSTDELDLMKKVRAGDMKTFQELVCPHEQTNKQTTGLQYGADDSGFVTIGRESGAVRIHRNISDDQAQGHLCISHLAG